MLTRFYWMPGITWSETGKYAGRMGMARSQVLDDHWASPEAVPTWIDGVSSLTFTLGACLVRYNLDAPESTIDEFFIPSLAYLPLGFFVTSTWGRYYWVLLRWCCLCMGGVLQLCLENNAEEVFSPLSLFKSNIIVDPRCHNNLIRHPGCLRWTFLLSS